LHDYARRAEAGHRSRHQPNARVFPERSATAAGIRPPNRLSAKPRNRFCVFAWAKKRPSPRAWSLSLGRWMAVLDRFLQFLGGSEGDLLARLDLDRLARRRVAAHAGGALTDLQNAESDHADALAFFQVADDRVDHVRQKRFRLLLRHVVALRQFGGDMLQRDSRNFRCSGHG